MTIEQALPKEEYGGIKTAVDIAIFNQNNQVLLGKRLVEAGFGTWGFPGGRLKTGEKIIQGSQREIKEELGEEIKIRFTDEILGVRENSIPPFFSHHVTVIIKGVHVGGEPKITEPEKCERWEWFSLNQLPKDLFSGVGEILENYQKRQVAVVSDWY